MEILLLKLLLAPSLVVASTLAGRRWGADVAGILVALPIVAGPILFISYQQQGGGFASGAAEASLLGLVSLAAFAVVFSRAARRFGWVVTLAISWTTVLVVDLLLSVFDATLLVAVGSTLVATVAAMILLPGVEPDRSSESKRPSWPSWDLPGRAIATGVLVVSVTTASGALGPHWTGLLAPFPIAASVVAAFVHAQHGSAATARTLAGLLVGLFSFATFCLLVAVLVASVGGAAFVVAAAVALAGQVVAVRARKALRGRRSALRP